MYEIYLCNQGKVMLGMSINELNIQALEIVNSINRFCLYPASMHQYTMKHLSGLEVLFNQVKLLYSLMELRSNGKNSQASRLLTLKEPKFYTQSLEIFEKWKKIFYRFQKLELKRHTTEYHKYIRQDWNELFGRDWSDLNQKFLASFVANKPEEQVKTEKTVK